MKAALALFAFAGFAAAAPAGIVVETYGAAAPPAAVDGWPIDWRVHFRSDVFADVTTTPDGGGGVIVFSIPVSVRAIGQGWATWSHGYTGNVFYTNGASSLTIGLSDIHAFQFYAEPNPFGIFQMTAAGSDGATTIAAQQHPDGDSGATGWGFCSWDAHVVSITVESDVDFAVGEFRVGFLTPPAPATLGPFALAGLVAGRRRRTGPSQEVPS
ncbi:MAG: hypothetical protein IT436_09030 [Phycisphaerales bacterium]|nr:hypothetical protein [Phycisphaerales bacterium]